MCARRCRSWPAHPSVSSPAETRRESCGGGAWEEFKGQRISRVRALHDEVTLISVYKKVIGNVDLEQLHGVPSDTLTPAQVAASGDLTFTPTPEQVMQAATGTQWVPT